MHFAYTLSSMITAFIQHQLCNINPRRSIGVLLAASGIFSAMLDLCRSYCYCTLHITIHVALFLKDQQISFLLHSQLHPHCITGMSFMFSCCAGESPQRLQGARIGVFVGQMSGDAVVIMGHNDDGPGFQAVGTARSMVANRLSHFFGFVGRFINFC